MDNDNISEYSYTSNIETGEVVNDNESDEVDINEEDEIIGKTLIKKEL